jgi:hypothetical protein
MSNRPTHSAYVVIPPKAGSDRKATWHEAGAIWPHKSGKGFDLVIPEGISVSGRIVILERKPNSDYEPSRTLTSAEFVEYLDERAAASRASMDADM